MNRLVGLSTVVAGLVLAAWLVGGQIQAASPWAAPLDVVIDEVAWGGTAANANHEWIELYATFTARPTWAAKSRRSTTWGRTKTRWPKRRRTKSEFVSFRRRTIATFLWPLWSIAAETVTFWSALARGWTEFAPHFRTTASAATHAWASGTTATVESFVHIAREEVEPSRWVLIQAVIARPRPIPVAVDECHIDRQKPQNAVDIELGFESRF